jgi:hypothetical protein
MGLPNYTSNLLRLGFEPDDLADGGSDRLVDALVAHGTVDGIARRLQEHVDAGADHLAVYVITGRSPSPPSASSPPLSPPSAGPDPGPAAAERRAVAWRCSSCTRAPSACGSRRHGSRAVRC